MERTLKRATEFAERKCRAYGKECYIDGKLTPFALDAFHSEIIKRNSKCLVMINEGSTDPKVIPEICDSYVVTVVLKNDDLREVEMCTNPKCPNYYMCTKCNIEFGTH